MYSMLVITYKRPMSKIKTCVSCAELNCAGAILLHSFAEIANPNAIFFQNPWFLWTRSVPLSFFYQTGGQRYETHFEHIWNLEPWVLVVTLACCYHGGWLPDAFIYKKKIC